MGDEKNRTRIKNGLLKIPKILSWGSTILSLYFSWISVKSGTLTLEWYIVVAIIIGNSIFLIICSLYEGFLYKKYTTKIALTQKDMEEKYNEKIQKYKQENSDLIAKKKQLSDNIDGLKKMNETVISTFLEITNKYNFYSLKLQAINDAYVSKIKQLARLNKKIIDDDKTKDTQNIEANEEFEKIEKIYEKDYIKAIIEAYNDFMGESTQKLKVALDNYLKTKSIDLGVSIAIKQLNRIITDIKEIKDVKVMTTFRDRGTYLGGNREVGKKEYTIYGNTDFLHCLRNSSYINNNLLDDDSYNNENPNYKNQYTCTAVVPIVWQYDNMVKFYGYLTCDAYDPAREYDGVMDKNIVYMMNSVASILARYFEDIQYSVQNMIYKDFFSELYVTKLGGIK